MGSKIRRKGVDAIFTSPKNERDVRFLVGIAGVVIGILLWMAVTLDSMYPALFGASEISSYSSLVLFSMGVILVTTGAGVSLTYHDFKGTHDRARRSPSQIDSEQENGLLASINLKYGLISFIQSSIAIALYSGLADEYQSNLSMREWIHSSFPLGQVLLARECVLVVAALMGLSIIMFLPGRGLTK